ncbi:hypothetical protein LUZ63_002508 [Rhynchospora breviuscula]|uniref:DUF7642 domain-containing protein n=1 Tax=Rhynchospora breviuscula TaxID=2022672 RepID=A0A9Q0CYW7_9POAL|nr:hypothetical protein LUZ63_002508 [Rhynchospora breviuscula]
MLSGHTASLHHRSDSGELLEDLISESDEEESVFCGKIVYRASFSELEENHLKYDIIIWVIISLLLVMAWGFGLLMLLYLPYKRHVLRKEISSTTLYVTEDNIVYKAFRPSFMPFRRPVKIKKQVPLHLVLEIIVEQGCLQAVYGVHTVRIVSRAHGKPAPVDELRFQGVTNPDHLRAIVVAEAAKSIRGRASRPVPTMSSFEGPLSTSRMRYHSDIPAFHKFLSPPSGKVRTPRSGSFDAEAAAPTGFLLYKLEEVNQSVKKIESLVIGSHSKAASADS